RVGPLNARRMPHGEPKERKERKRTHNHKARGAPAGCGDDGWHCEECSSGEKRAAGIGEGHHEDEWEDDNEVKPSTTRAECGSCENHTYQGGCSSGVWAVERSCKAPSALPGPN